MLKKILLSLASILAGTMMMAQNHDFNRAPLLEKDYAQLPLGSIKAAGWLEDQLVLMRNGMTGNLDKLTWKHLALHFPLAANLGKGQPQSENFR